MQPQKNELMIENEIAEITLELEAIQKAKESLKDFDGVQDYLYKYIQGLEQRIDEIETQEYEKPW